MIRTELNLFKRLQTENDMLDLLWLADNHETTFNAMRNKLSYEHREFFFEAFIDEYKKCPNADRLKQVLGVTWPPEE